VPREVEGERAESELRQPPDESPPGIEITTLLVDEYRPALAGFAKTLTAEDELLRDWNLDRRRADALALLGGVEDTGAAFSE
jgi:hypothetical protein